MEEILISKTKSKKKGFFNKLKKKFLVLFTSYLLTYKSLSSKKITIFWSLIIFGIIFLFLSINALSNKFIITIPSYGGTLNEGIIGIPRYINPVLASSDSDKDMTILIYSGLLRKDINNNIVNDIAENIEESEDHLTFTVKISDKAVFQDNTKITADDVIFTISKIQNKNINSPLAIKFEGVDVEKGDNENTVIFHLKKPYFYFKESLTFGILPKHIWENISDTEFPLSEHNTNPIGSGPYKISNIKKENNLTKEYNLSAFKDFIKGKPFISNLNIIIYNNNDDLFEAMKNKEIDSTGYSDIDHIKKYTDNKNLFINSSLPISFTISLNPSKNNLLGDKNIRNLLSNSIDKEYIVNNILNGQAKTNDYIFDKNIEINNIEASDTNKVNKNISEINLTTVDILDLKNIANAIASDWAKIGIKVNIKLYSLGDIANIIKDRNFEALLFGSVIEHDTDLYAYWHSSQRNYPGLNITNYASKNLDKNLEILRNSMNKEERDVALENINKEIKNESQVIPLYSTNFTYILKDKDLYDKLNNKIPKNINDQSERFLDIKDWYLYKENVWKISYLEKLIEKLENIIH